MKYIIEIPDNKSALAEELFKSISFVKKMSPLSGEKAQLINEIKEAVVNLNLVKKGKLKARSAKQLLNEL
jgi:polyhydroxyalkanoate synthesis regulator phasin